MGYADEGDAFEELLGCGGGDGTGVYVAEAVFALGGVRGIGWGMGMGWGTYDFLRPFADTGVVGHDFIVVNGWWVGCDLGSPEFDTSPVNILILWDIESHTALARLQMPELVCCLCQVGSCNFLCVS